MGQCGSLKCCVCIEKAEVTKNPNIIDQAYTTAYLPIFYGSIDIIEFLTFIENHKNCDKENQNHIIYDHG